MSIPSGSLILHLNYVATGVHTHISNRIALLTDSPARTFYRNLLARGYLPNVLIDVLPEHRLLYVNVPKCASTTVRALLSRLVGRKPAATPDEQHIRWISGLKAPRHVGIARFHRIATDPATLRFSLVRNPYSRLVSAWADKFQNKPLAHGARIIDEYLDWRPTIDGSLPCGPDRALGFPDFVTYATATADRRVNIHWQMQDDILGMPGINLDFVGRVESFETDFIRVLDHVNAPQQLRRSALASQNVSRRERCRHYLTPDLAERIYRAYERDFDRLNYPRALPE